MAGCYDHKASVRFHRIRENLCRALVYQRAFAAFLYQAEIPCPQNLLTGFPRELELQRDCRKIGVTYSSEQTNMGASKNAALSRKSIVRMTDVKGLGDMKQPRNFIIMNA